jgi:hypothetical protein
MAAREQRHLLENRRRKICENRVQGRCCTGKKFAKTGKMPKAARQVKSIEFLERWWQFERS